MSGLSVPGVAVRVDDQTGIPLRVGRVGMESAPQREGAPERESASQQVTALHAMPPLVVAPEVVMLRQSPILA